MGNIYVGGSDNKAHIMKQAWIGVEGCAREIKAIYLGVNGVAKLVWESAIGKIKKVLNVTNKGTVYNTTLNNGSNPVIASPLNCGNNKYILHTGNIRETVQLLTLNTDCTPLSATTFINGNNIFHDMLNDVWAIGGNYGSNYLYNINTGAYVYNNLGSQYTIINAFSLPNNKFVIIYYNSSSSKDEYYMGLYKFNGSSITKIKTQYLSYATRYSRNGSCKINENTIAISIISQNSSAGLSIYRFESDDTITSLAWNSIYNYAYTGTNNLKMWALDNEHILVNDGNVTTGIAIDYNTKQYSYTNQISKSFLSRIGTSNTFFIYENNMAGLIYYDMKNNKLTYEITTIPNYNYIGYGSTYLPYQDNKIIQFYIGSDGSIYFGTQVFEFS